MDGGERLARPATAPACSRCGRALTGSAYEVRASEGRVHRCLRCALTHRPLIMRSLTIAVIVGTVLTAINQGNVLLAGDLPPALAWKIPLTYVVPYCVATTGTILNARTR